MFPWSAVFSAEQQALDQRSSEELVTRTLMLELTALLKRSEKLQQDRATALRRRGSCVDYSWLASPQKLTYELPARDFLELEKLCARIPPAQCGPIILRVRTLVTEFEPEVGEVSRLFRSVLRACLEEAEQGERDGGSGSLRERAQRWSLEWERRRRQRHLRSLSLVSLHSCVQVHPLQNPTPAHTNFLRVDDGGGAGRPMRARSLPQINVVDSSTIN